MIMFVRLVLLSVFAFGTPIAFSQTSGSPSNLALQERNEPKPIPAAENPFVSFTIFVSKGGAPRGFSGVEKGAMVLSYNLSADGSILSRNSRFSRQPLSSASLVNRVKFYGNTRGSCVLDLRIYDEDVTFASLVTAIQRLDGVESKFERFRIDARFSKEEKEVSNLQKKAANTK